MYEELIRLSGRACNLHSEKIHVSHNRTVLRRANGDELLQQHKAILAPATGEALSAKKNESQRVLHLETTSEHMRSQVGRVERNGAARELEVDAREEPCERTVHRDRALHYVVVDAVRLEVQHSYWHCGQVVHFGLERRAREPEGSCEHLAAGSKPFVEETHQVLEMVHYEPRALPLGVELWRTCRQTLEARYPLKMPKEANKLGDSNKKTGIEPRIPIGRRRYVAQCKPEIVQRVKRALLRMKSII